MITLDLIMKTININYAKIISYVLIIILTVIVMSQFSTNNKTQLANDELKKEIKDKESNVKKYFEANNLLNEKITYLENQKVKIKKEVVEKIKTIYIEKEKVKSYTTNDFAKYYSKRYNDEVLASSSGVILEDITALKNVQELLDKDAMVFELQGFKNQLNLEEQKSSLKDTIINNLNFVSLEKDKTLNLQNQIIKNTEKSLIKEKTKKNFWKLATIGVLGGATYLLIAN
jgi:hypothetical protein